MARALVTGGAGFLGLHLSRRLQADGHEVHLVDDFSRGVRDRELSAFAALPRVHLHAGDLRRGDALELLGDEVELVFHLAAIVGVTHVLERPYAVLTDNLSLLTQTLAFARRQRRLSRFVFASTSEVYAGSLALGQLPIPTPETAPLSLPALAHPRTSYALSKIYGEALCHHAQLPVTIVRPHNVYGPRMGMAHVVPELLQRAHRASFGSTLTVASVDHRRTFCFIDDAVELLVRLASSERAVGQTFNLGAQEPEVSMGELAEKVIAVVGKPLALLPLPATPGSPARRCPDVSHALDATSYRAQVTLDEGLARTYRWYQEHVFDGDDACAR